MLSDAEKPKRGIVPQVELDLDKPQTNDGTVHLVAATQDDPFQSLLDQMVRPVDYLTAVKEIEEIMASNHAPDPRSQLAPPSHWLGDGKGNLDGAEMRLLRQSMRLQPRDISQAMLGAGRDCPPGVVSRWEQNSQFGPPADVCTLLWVCDRAVQAVVAQVLEYAITHRCIPDRHGGKAVDQFEGFGLEDYSMSAEAFQSLQVTAWDRALLVLRTRGLTLEMCKRV
jgi:hypothetical protein